MADEIKKCTIVSGAPNDNIEFLKSHIDRASFIIAADSGYKKLLSAEIIPDAIVADFDSSKKPDLPCEIITFPIEKAYSDTFNSIIFAKERGFNDITVFFAIGNRFDHSYSNVLCLDYCRKNNIKCRIIDDKNRISLVCDKAEITNEYQCFSLFAFLEECKGVKIEGAHYSQDFFNQKSMDIKPSDTFAQSNFVEADKAYITLESGTLLLIESND
ncbi:MAG: thiamine diphosphokinase [Eubacterium sp.]|nr:thiamine diphosphokinase [Eubacterium sp.]